MGNTQIQICINMSHNDATRWNNQKDTIWKRYECCLKMYCFSFLWNGEVLNPIPTGVLASGGRGIIVVVMNRWLWQWNTPTHTPIHAHTRAQREREKNANSTTGRQSDTSSCLDSQVPRWKAFTASRAHPLLPPTATMHAFSSPTQRNISFVFCFFTLQIQWKK